MSLSQTPKWVAIYTAPRAEKIVTARISQDLHLEVYLPLHKVRRKWSDRIKYVETPLIPSYTFVKMREQNIHQVRTVHGVCGFVTFPSSGIATIPESEIDYLRRLVESKEEIYVHNSESLKCGAEVTVVDGVFKGMVGTIVTDCKDGNFAVKISGLNIHLVITLETAALATTQSTE